MNGILENLKELSEVYTDKPLAAHIVLALADYENIEFVDDKTFEECLDKYISMLELDGSIDKVWDYGEEY